MPGPTLAFGDDRDRRDGDGHMDQSRSDRQTVMALLVLFRDRQGFIALVLEFPGLFLDLFVLDRIARGLLRHFGRLRIAAGDSDLQDLVLQALGLEERPLIARLALLENSGVLFADRLRRFDGFETGDNSRGNSQRTRSISTSSTSTPPTAATRASVRCW